MLSWPAEIHISILNMIERVNSAHLQNILLLTIDYSLIKQDRKLFINKALGLVLDWKSPQSDLYSEKVKEVIIL